MYRRNTIWSCHSPAQAITTVPDDLLDLLKWLMLQGGSRTFQAGGLGGNSYIIYKNYIYTLQLFTLLF